MNDSRFESAIRFVIDANELVRGQEQQFLEQLKPLVRNQNVLVDLTHVARIDAAGLAALITLYCDACKAGRRFAVANPSHRVEEILALVGLDAILVARQAVKAEPVYMQFEETAA